jgi:hypothetical protein
MNKNNMCKKLGLKFSGRTFTYDVQDSDWLPSFKKKVLCLNRGQVLYHLKKLLEIEYRSRKKKWKVGI